MTAASHLGKGGRFRDLPKVYVVFLFAKDPFGDGLPLHTMRTVCLESDEEAGYGYHALFLDVSACKGDDALGRLACNLLCTSADEMSNGPMKSRMTEIKGMKIGGKEMRSTLKEFMDYGFSKGHAEGMEKGMEKGAEKGLMEAQAEAARRMFAKGYGADDVSELLGITAEDAKRIAEG